MLSNEEILERARLSAERSRQTAARGPVIIDLPRAGERRRGSAGRWRLLVLAGLVAGGVFWLGPAQVGTQAVAGFTWLRQSFHDAFDDPAQHPKPAPKATPAGVRIERAVAIRAPLVAPPPRALPVEQFGSLRLESKGPPAEATWPRSVALEGTPEVTTVSEAPDVAKYIYHSPNYEFIADSPVGADVVRECARVFEATYQLNCRLPLDLRPVPEYKRERFVAKLFSGPRAYLAAGGMTDSSGTSDRRQACILVPITSLGIKLVNGRMQTDRTDSTDTLVHEITHQMMNAWLPRLPRWYSEGSADYVAMADYVHGRFFMNQMEDRLRLYLRRRGKKTGPFPMLRPAELMALDGATWSQALASNAAGASQNYASATLLTYYFYHLDGNGDSAGILGYLRAIESGTPEPDAASEHLIRGRTAAALEEDVITAFEHHGVSLTLASRGGKT